MAYSEYDKAMAVEIVHRNKGVLDSACLATIRETLSSPELRQQTIRYWLKTKPVDQNPKVLSDQKKAFDPKTDSQEIREQISTALDQKLEAAAHKFVDHATSADVMERMSGSAAMVSAGIAIEKMRLLRDLPTEIIGAASILTKLNELFKQLNTPIGDALEDYYQKLHAMVDAQNGSDK